ncbi:hypothetical protein PMI07_000837 [Rhizobium sp. CF080]|nr:hypothetical protein PMI07_000837 [Rhizobium sp. CF080]
MKTAINDFRVWVARLGFNGRQISQAAELMGITGSNTVSLISTGKRELTVSERLAMSAVRAGLKPWTPEYDDELRKAGLVRQDPTAA